ncbi:MAG: hypothetical protein LLG00_04690 [Planctomycetaceae bacterium]|nr:hypothetical protein [Planctomycetaceae bacterium]
MSDLFDPYFAWLGIREPERPPNHYRLLGVTLFEDDSDVLSKSAERQMDRVRTSATGEHEAERQRLLGEIAAAKAWLLDPAKKAAYDGALLAKLSQGAVEPLKVAPRVEPTAEPGTVGPPPDASASMVDVADGSSEASRSTSPGRRQEVILPIPSPGSGTAMSMLLVGLMVLLVLGLVVVWRNVNAVRNEVLNGWGMPPNVSTLDDAGDARTQPRQPAGNGSRK